MSRKHVIQNRTGASETLAGGFARDVIFGLGGNDFVSGGKRADVLDGGAGNDSFAFTGNPLAQNAAGVGAVAVAGDGDGVRQVVNGPDNATDNILDLNTRQDTIAFDASDFRLNDVRFFNAAKAARPI